MGTAAARWSWRCCVLPRSRASAHRGSQLDCMNAGGPQGPTAAGRHCQRAGLRGCSSPSLTPSLLTQHHERVSSARVVQGRHQHAWCHHHRKRRAASYHPEGVPSSASQEELGVKGGQHDAKGLGGSQHCSTGWEEAREGGERWFAVRGQRRRGGEVRSASSFGLGWPKLNPAGTSRRNAAACLQPWG